METEPGEGGGRINKVLWKRGALLRAGNTQSVCTERAAEAEPGSRSSGTELSGKITHREKDKTEQGSAVSPGN